MKKIKIIILATIFTKILVLAASQNKEEQTTPRALTPIPSPYSPLLKTSPVRFKPLPHTFNFKEEDENEEEERRDSDKSEVQLAQSEKR